MNPINSDQNTEREWVVRLTQDDEQAFCHLYATYRDRLLYFALRMLKSDEFAEDIFQDTFAAVWRNRHFLNPDAPFGAYLYTIMRNRILNMLAKLHKHTELKSHLEEKAIDCEGENTTPLALLEAKDLQALYESAIKQLTPQQQTVFHLSREEMLTHKEIADRLQLSVNTVQQHISAALRTLRKALQPLDTQHTDLVVLLVLLL